MLHADGTRWAVALGLAMAMGCDGPEPIEDGGRDSGQVVTDSGPPDSEVRDDGGEPCEGPPGLYEAGACDVVAAGVRAYRPLFFLWSDGAAKERYIYLPPGTQIDTTDPDNWVFPDGTRIYKTFLRGGVRLETRVLEKHDAGIGPASWYMRAYAWNEAQTAVTEVQDADATIRENVLGTEHDIPSQAQCIECHSGSLDTSNSFSAIQLNHDLGGLNLQMLNDEALLTTPIDVTEARVPGTEVEQAALGYLHANCGNCHRQTPGAPGECLTPACRSGLRMWVDVANGVVQDTDTWTTAVDVRGTFFDPDAPTAVCRVHPGAPETSTVVFRMTARGDSSQMPPIGTEVNDPDGIDAVSAWISTLTSTSTVCTP